MSGVRTTILAMATGVLLVGCGGGDGGGTAAPPASSSPAPSEAPGPVLSTADADLGELVVDAEGRTVYVFDEDVAGSGGSACTDDCAATWPAVVVEDGAPVADGVDGELGTIEREDGTRQVTLDDRPLYLFAGDGSPGDVTGQGVDGTWFVVGADGEKITAGAADPGFSY